MIGNELTQKERRWVDRLIKLVDSQPETITVLVRPNTLSICRPDEIRRTFDRDGHLEYLEEIELILSGEKFEPNGEIV